ncbi:predicted protein [Plenodomus lingam JN3]|uniref:Predicted protein n=1 Tax=Leptosphaeria maculans (strain JN3 / isolate v23.1.3 / race Av1-4-5-6-7-8) TaxID=985895 RepID=E4ZW85_LEPMJ|nr:predicted protein [Plenodomus lingam JN3]CBX95861.1 predicted protein [Plenodomus lingam JN3]
MALCIFSVALFSASPISTSISLHSPLNRINFIFAGFFLLSVPPKPPQLQPHQQLQPDPKVFRNGGFGDRCAEGLGVELDFAAAEEEEEEEEEEGKE